LLHLAQQFGVYDDGAVRVTRDLAQGELGQLVGTSRETVNKALSDRSQQGGIRLDGTTVVIIDSERLGVSSGTHRQRSVIAQGGERWEWSAEAAHIHGYPSVEMHPTTVEVMLHKHPDDVAKMIAALEQVRRTQRSINTRHRIIDVQGHTREVLVVGQQLRDDTGTVIGTHGFYVDVTPAVRALHRQESGWEELVGKKVAEILEHRTVIDEVKGMLMLIYRIDGARAFDILRWRSQATNSKLRVFVEQLLDDVVALDYDETLPPRSVFDDLLLTAHRRVTHHAES
jgi:PAS domain S-box-containing protein